MSIGIIGGGPAGISAAVQLCRSDFRVTLFEGGVIGGLIRNAWRVDNLPVLPMTPGPVIAAYLEQRLHESGVQLVRTFVEQLSFNFDSDLFAVESTAGTFFFHTLLLASGTLPAPWPLPKECAAAVLPYIHRHVADLDAAKKIWAVIGSGDAAYDYALTLCDAGGSVFLLQRAERVHALPLLQRQLGQRQIPRICGAELTAVRVVKNDRLSLDIRQGPDCFSIEVHGLIAAIGRIPADGFVARSVSEREDALNQAGRFFRIGDVRGGKKRQLAIAMGDGLNAAMEIAMTWPAQIRSE